MTDFNLSPRLLVATETHLNSLTLAYIYNLWGQPRTNRFNLTDGRYCPSGNRHLYWPLLSVMHERVFTASGPFGGVVTAITPRFSLSSRE